MPRYSTQQKNEMAELYAKGIGTMEICSRFGCSDGALYTALRRAELPVRGVKSPRPATRKAWTTNDIEGIVWNWKAGFSKSRIAREYKTYPGAIDCILRAYGYDPSDLRYAKGKNNHRWKGGRIVDQAGYVQIRVTDKIKQWLPENWKNPYAREHRVVMARHLGRPLSQHETVHHINGDTLDNRIDNLQLRGKAHGEGQVFICQDCGSHNVQPSII